MATYMIQMNKQTVEEGYTIHSVEAQSLDEAITMIKAGQGEITSYTPYSHNETFNNPKDVTKN